MPSRSLGLSALLLSIVLLRIYFWILPKDSLILPMSEAKCSIELWSKIALKLLSQDSGSRAWLMSYWSYILNIFLFSVPFLLRVGWVFSTHYGLTLKERSDTLLTQWGWLLRVAYSSQELSDITIGSSSTMLLLSYWALVMYFSSYLLKNMDEVLGLCVLEVIVWPLTLL